MSKSSMLFQNIEAKQLLFREAKDGNRKTMLLGDVKRYRRILVEQIHEDLEIAPHITSRYGHPLVLSCSICHMETTPTSVSVAADWIDAHAHGPAWECDTCGMFENGWATNCRFCGEGRQGQLADAKVSVARQVVRYAVRLAGETVAWVEAPSLLRARRAARGMWPHAGQALTVRSEHGEWTATYGHRKEGP